MEKIIKRFFLIVFMVIFLTSITVIIINLIQRYNDKKTNTNILDSIKLPEGDGEIDVYTDEATASLTSPREIQLKLKELKKINKDIVGWLRIDGTNIDYPVLQTINNDFYLTHNYKKSYSKIGSIFLDTDVDISMPSTNYLIYGHRTNQGLMFEELIKYADTSFYLGHKKIQFITQKDCGIYEILSVFYSRVYRQDETNVFRYYYFIDAKTESDYNNYVLNAKSASIYNTGVTAKFPEQLLTLSTCEYSRKNGRFVIVAKKIN